MLGVAHNHPRGTCGARKLAIFCHKRITRIQVKEKQNIQIREESNMKRYGCDRPDTKSDRECDVTHIPQPVPITLERQDRVDE